MLQSAQAASRLHDSVDTELPAVATPAPSASPPLPLPPTPPTAAPPLYRGELHETAFREVLTALRAHLPPLDCFCRPEEALTNVPGGVPPSLRWYFLWWNKI